MPISTIIYPARRGENIALDVQTMITDARGKTLFLETVGSFVLDPRQRTLRYYQLMVSPRSAQVLSELTGELHKVAQLFHQLERGCAIAFHPLFMWLNNLTPPSGLSGDGIDIGRLTTQVVVHRRQAAQQQEVA